MKAKTGGSRRASLYRMVLFSVILALEAIVCFTPLGSLPAIGPVVATLSHIPVIAAAVLMGPLWGAGMGFFFGLFSFIVWTFMPPNPLLAFCFTPFYSAGAVSGSGWSLVICFVPRILIGIVAGLTARAFKRVLKGAKLNLACSLAGLAGSLTNTILVLAGIWLFFGRPYAAALGVGYEALMGIILSTILTNGIPEAVLGAVLSGSLARVRIKFS